MMINSIKGKMQLKNTEQKQARPHMELITHMNFRDGVSEQRGTNTIYMFRQHGSLTPP